jgi:hypothetical protein
VLQMLKPHTRQQSRDSTDLRVGCLCGITKAVRLWLSGVRRTGSGRMLQNASRHRPTRRRPLSAAGGKMADVRRIYGNVELGWRISQH